MQLSAQEVWTGPPPLKPILSFFFLSPNLLLFASPDVSSSTADLHGGGGEKSQMNDLLPTRVQCNNGRLVTKTTTTTTTDEDGVKATAV